MDCISFMSEVGFPIAAAVAAGFFIYLAIKYILASVVYQINHIASIITGLHKRVTAMNHDVIRIDTLISSSLGLKIDTDRIERADNEECRKD